MGEPARCPRFKEISTVVCKNSSNKRLFLAPLYFSEARGKGSPHQFAELCEANFSGRNGPPINSPILPILLRPFIGRYFFVRFHSKFFLKSPKKRTPRWYFKKFLRFVARLRATFGVFGGISERAFDLGARPAEGRWGTRRVPPHLLKMMAVF